MGFKLITCHPLYVQHAVSCVSRRRKQSRYSIPEGLVPVAGRWEVGTEVFEKQARREESPYAVVGVSRRSQGTSEVFGNCLRLTIAEQAG